MAPWRELQMAGFRKIYWVISTALTFHFATVDGVQGFDLISLILFVIAAHFSNINK